MKGESLLAESCRKVCERRKFRVKIVVFLNFEGNFGRLLPDGVAQKENLPVGRGIPRAESVRGILRTLIV